MLRRRLGTGLRGVCWGVGWAMLGIAALAYVIDSAGVAFPGNRQMYEDVRVDHVYTDTNRWYQVEYSRGDPTMEQCVKSLFPHGGHKPCWYLKKHTLRITNTD